MFGHVLESLLLLLVVSTTCVSKCDPPQDFDAKGDSTLTARFHFETKDFILARLRRALRSA